MTKKQVRELVADAFENANVVGFQYDNRKNKFLQGEKDIQFSELDIDSLSAMEVCIAIELSTGISIVPQDFVRMDTLDNFVAELLERMDD